MAQTGASANVSGCDTRIISEIFLRVGMPFGSAPLNRGKVVVS
jgi:hypothetical protein